MLQLQLIKHKHKCTLAASAEANNVCKLYWVAATARGGLKHSGLMKSSFMQLNAEVSPNIFYLLGGITNL
jgi:hypothetical protein